MKNLQSELMPFRKVDAFYTPKDRVKSNSSIKVYAQHSRTIDRVFHSKDQLTPNKKETISYLDELYKTRALQRRPLQKQQYYPNNKPWKNQSLPISRNTSIHHIFSELSPEQHPKYSFKARNSYLNKIAQRKRQKSKNERSMTFYNNLKKNQLIIEKFKDWRNFDERKSASYQNAMNRTITAVNILDTLKERDRKLRRGDWLNV